MSDPEIVVRHEQQGDRHTFELMAACCDFCLGPDPVWEHYAALFTVQPDGDVPGFVDEDGVWGACAYCHDLLVREDFPSLVHRLWTLVESPPTAAEERYHQAVLDGFWKHRTGTWLRH